MNGFSADGGALSGVVKAETYAGFLKVEASLINFAPLSEGRYVCGITDGLKTAVFEGANYEEECDFNLAYGFAFIVCYCNNSCRPIADAACGQMACALPDLKEEMARRELPQSQGAQNSKGKAAGKSTGKLSENSEGKTTGKSANKTPPEQSGAAAYDDEAIAEVNYYEYGADEDGGAVRQGKTQKKSGRAGGENEENSGAFAAREKGLNGTYYGVNGKNEGDSAVFFPDSRAAYHDSVGAEYGDPRAAYSQSDGGEIGSGGESNGSKEGEISTPRLAGGDFYGRMRGDIEKIFATYPKEEKLESAMEGSRWAKVPYGSGKFYVFGVLSVEGSPRYVCYGVPSADGANPPASLAGCASFMPVDGGGYWIMYQDAGTGVSVKITNG